MAASLKRVISEEETLWPDIAALHGLRLPNKSNDVNVNQWYISKYLIQNISKISMFVYEKVQVLPAGQQGTKGNFILSLPNRFHVIDMAFISGTEWRRFCHRGKKKQTKKNN